MTALGQQRPLSDPDVRPRYDRVGADPLEDQVREGLMTLTENAVRGLVGEWAVQTHASCAHCGCVGTKKA